MKQRKDHWIITLADGSFMEHPRGGSVAHPDDAYGYHYKNEAEKQAASLGLNKSAVRRRMWVKKDYSAKLTE